MPVGILPPSIHQYLIMWHSNGSVEIVKVNVKPFAVTSSAPNALLYTYDIDIGTFFGRDNERCQTIYSMSQRHENNDYQFSRSIFTFTDDFGNLSDGDQ